MNTQPLTSRWKELLAIENRRAPELFEPDDHVADTPYADEIRKTFSKLSVSAMFCVQGVPTVAIVNQPQYNRDEVVRVHAALWNQGLASMLVVVTDDTVRVFSLAKAPGTGDDSQFEDRCLIEALDAGAAALSLSGYVSGAESGRLWRDKAEHFNSKERIDYVLLNNLTVAHDLLVANKLSPSEAQAVLIQTMFIAYLEDRKITESDYFKAATKGKSMSFAGLLTSGNVENLERLFKQLQQDFNGDLFVAPCSFETDDRPHRLNAHCMDILQRFRDGREEMSATSSQMRFWGYDFRYIPVELISAVYDRFLGEDDDARRDAGAYYTPMFLADTVVSSLWEKLPDRTRDKGAFLDPACGSGIFLVRCFQRMCEHWRANAKQSTIRWDSLLRMLARVHGRDLNGGAARVAVFSLYIALLEEVTPPDIRKLVDNGRLLPTLWNKTIVQRDFFDEDPEDLSVDVIIGNPPWTSRRNTKSSGMVWSQERRLPVPSREEAWAFTWKAREHLRPGGITAFLLPAMGFLHNRAALSVKARERLFADTKVLRVINFADLRRQLFDGAISPAALVLFTERGDDAPDYKFEYWAPKADLNMPIKRFISLSSIDKSVLRESDVAANSLLFKQRLWMREPEAKLFSYLSSLPRLNGFISEYGKLKKRRQSVDDGWVMGQGFKPYYGGEEGSSSAQHYDSDFVGRYKHLPIEAYATVALSTSNLKKWGASVVHRRGFERGFSGPRIIIPQGVQTSRTRLRAAYTEAPFTFQHSLQTIVAPPQEKRRLKLVTAILNSRIAVWFSFHGTGSFGSGLPKVHQSDLLTIPCPAPNDLGCPKKAKSAEDKIIQLIDSRLETSEQLLQASDTEEVMLREIDQLVYAYFSLSKDEITLIEDGVEYFIPASQPNAGAFPDIWKSADISDRRIYAKSLSRSLDDWFGNDMFVSVSLTARNQDTAILKLSLSNACSEKGYVERSDDTFTASLSRLGKAINQTMVGNFQTIPDMRIFVGDSLYLIKPLQLRFWLASSALADADSIASDLQTLIEADRQRGLAS